MLSEIRAHLTGLQKQLKSIGKRVAEADNGGIMPSAMAQAELLIALDKAGDKFRKLSAELGKPACDDGETLYDGEPKE